MAFFVDSRFLSSTRLRKIITTMAHELQFARPLVYLDRTALVNASDDEIVGRFSGQVIAADIIADDQQAVVHTAGKVELHSYPIPNLKNGQRVGQAKLNLMERLRNQGGRADEEDELFDWEQNFAENLLFGVRQRMNALCCAAEMDAWSYDRLGIKVSNATWGMPAGLKVTPATLWTDAANATPIADIFSLDEHTRDNFGFIFDRLTMSSVAFRRMVATTEFANKASIPLQAHFLVTSAALSVRDQPQMLQVAAQVLGKDIQIDDAQYTEVTNAGAQVSRRYLPTNKVILTRKQDDNDPRVRDLANGVVTESIVAAMSDVAIEGFGEAAYGPVGYFTPSDMNLNPPGIIGWAVARCFPRKHIPESSGVLTVA